MTRFHQHCHPLLVSIKRHLSRELLPGYHALVPFRFLCPSLCSNYLSITPADIWFIDVFAAPKSRWISIPTHNWPYPFFHSTLAFFQEETMCCVWLVCKSNLLVRLSRSLEFHSSIGTCGLSNGHFVPLFSALLALTRRFVPTCTILWPLFEKGMHSNVVRPALFRPQIPIGVTA